MSWRLPTSERDWEALMRATNFLIYALLPSHNELWRNMSAPLEPDVYVRAIAKISPDLPVEIQNLTLDGMILHRALQTSEERQFVLMLTMALKINAGVSIYAHVVTAAEFIGQLAIELPNWAMGIDELASLVLMAMRHFGIDAVVEAAQTSTLSGLQKFVNSYA